MLSHPKPYVAIRAGLLVRGDNPPGTAHPSTHPSPGPSRSLFGMDIVLTLHSFTHSSTSLVYPTLFYAQSHYGV